MSTSRDSAGALQISFRSDNLVFYPLQIPPVVDGASISPDNREMDWPFPDAFCFEMHRNLIDVVDEGNCFAKSISARASGKRLPCGLVFFLDEAIRKTTHRPLPFGFCAGNLLPPPSCHRAGRWQFYYHAATQQRRGASCWTRTWGIFQSWSLSCFHAG